MCAVVWCLGRPCCPRVRCSLCVCVRVHISLHTCACVSTTSRDAFVCVCVPVRGLALGTGMSFELMMKRLLTGELGVATTSHYRLLVMLARNGPLFVRLGGLRYWIEKVNQV